MNKEIKSELPTNNVFLNFIHTIIDENIYDEIKKSDFLKNEFCNGQEKIHRGKTDLGIEMSWTGFYMIGENTYIQLFSKKDQEKLQKMKVGCVGIEFMVDQKEEIEKIINTFKQKFTSNIEYGIFEKNVNNTLIPWFYYIDDSSMLPGLDMGVMAYHNDYLKFKNMKNWNRDSITRNEYNTTCNAILFDKTKLFKDIEEITLLLNNEVKRKFIEQQMLLGYSCEEVEDYMICHGPKITFKLKSTDKQTCKFLQLQMSLNHEIKDLQVYKFGSSILKLENKTALWTFKE